MRACLHPNLISCSGVFAIRSKNPAAAAAAASKSLDQIDSVWLLMPFANAKHLEQEISRYPDSSTPEAGARFYTRQICAAVQHLHDRRISHGDLHERNVLMRIKADRTKDCLICDFGHAVLGREGDEMGLLFARDFATIVQLLMLMMPNRREATRVMLRDYLKRWRTSSIESFLQDPWFRKPAVPPIPPASHEPSPMLRKRIKEREYARLGYASPIDPTGARSPEAGARFPRNKGPVQERPNLLARIASRFRSQSAAGRNDRPAAGKEEEPISSRSRARVVARSAPSTLR